MPDEFPVLDRNDRGKGGFNQYRYALRPNSTRVTMRLAGSNPYQAELEEILAGGSSSLETAMSRRTQQEDSVDAPIAVRLFTGSRVSPIVGWIPRGLESIVDETLSRLDLAGRKQRIPVAIVRKGGLLRVELLIGQTR